MWFSFVERGAGLPISAAVADLLLGRSAPRIDSCPRTGATKEAARAMTIKDRRV
jgi:hypothetical protein